jgi:MFS family permease
MTCPPTILRSWPPVALAMGTVAWGGNEFTPLLAMYRDISGFSQLTVDILLAAYILGVAPALLVGGPLSDRIGRRRVMLPAAPISAAGSAVLACWPNSVPAMSLGRVLCGIGLGLVMAVGATWIKELTERHGEQLASAAQRASAALTTGFLTGAASAGVLAQWGPWPHLSPYIVHLILTAIAGGAVAFVPETRPPRPATRTRAPNKTWGRFARVVLPIAPWVFTAATVAYAIIPSLLATRYGGAPIALSALITTITLTAGLLGQQYARRISNRRAAPVAAAVGSICAGMLFAAWTAATLRWETALLSAITLGFGYGLALVAGLTEVQRTTRDEHLGTTTAVYFALTYLGFTVPAIFAGLQQWTSYVTLLGATIPLALSCAAISLTGQRRATPEEEDQSEFPSLYPQDIVQTIR